MRYYLCMKAACALGVLIASSLAYSDTPKRAEISPSDVRYRVVYGWPELPENTMLDEVSGVAVDSKGNVFVLTRGGRKWPDSDVLDQTPVQSSTVFVFDGHSGRLLTKWGEKVMALPHQISIDRNDNVWIADVALHQVFKFSPDGKLRMTIGERGVSGDDNQHFNRPSDVAVAPDGSFYVSDGYGNNRVMKFSANGDFLMAWGMKGKAPGQFDLPHGIAIDTRGHVYVLDRGNRRVQVFDAEGGFLAEWNGQPFVSPQDMIIDAKGNLFVADGGNDQLPDRCGVWRLRPDGSVAGHFARYGNYDGQFVDPHAIAIDQNQAVYVADFSGKRVQKFVPLTQTNTSRKNPRQGQK
jgi:peptidylamidoglycolate lyase